MPLRKNLMIAAGLLGLSAAPLAAQPYGAPVYAAPPGAVLVEPRQGHAPPPPGRYGWRHHHHHRHWGRRWR